MNFFRNVTIMCCLASFLFGVTISEIKNDEQYLWGEGRNTIPARADKQALKQLVSQVSLQVESKFTSIVQEQGEDIGDYTEVILNTYSNVMLNEARQLESRNNGVSHVLRYITKKNMAKVFEERHRLILNYVRGGNRAKQDLRIGDALKNYYWALCLLKSHPDMNTISGEKANMPGLLITVLPEKIENVMDSIQIDIRSSEYIKRNKNRRTLLNFKYGNKPVANLDYRYYTGSGWTGNLTTVKNGLGIADFYGAPAKDMDDIKVRIEYVYEDKSKLNVALRQVISTTYIPYFPESQRKISSFIVSRTPKREKIKTEVVGTMNDVENSSNMDENCFRTVLKFKEAYEKKQQMNARACFTDKGRDQFIKLLKYGNAEFVKTGKVELECCKLNDFYLVRSLPYKFSFPGSSREFIENLVFVLDENAKICAITFSLSDIAINDIMDKGKDWGSIEQKQQIIHFMESYKTAYCLENIDYIRKIFSDEALIIVGQVLKKGGNVDSMYIQKLNKEDVKYIRMNKKQYLSRLERIFSNSESINIHFEESDVSRVNRKEDFVYGIQIAQNYYSSNYADFGYLFLMFDLNDPKLPKIYVRSWQPEKNKEGRIIGLSDFQ